MISRKISTLQNSVCKDDIKAHMEVKFQVLQTSPKVNVGIRN